MPRVKSIPVPVNAPVIPPTPISSPQVHVDVSSNVDYYTPPVPPSPSVITDTVAPPVAPTKPKKKTRKTSTTTLPPPTTPDLPVEDLIVSNLETVESTPVPDVATTTLPPPPLETVEAVDNDVALPLPLPVTTTTTDDSELLVDKKRLRRQVTKESFHQDFEALYQFLETEWFDKKPLFKQFKQLRSDAYKLLKIRNQSDTKTGRGENNNSGFMKPVLISDDLAQFIGHDRNQPITRVMITKKICQHIKQQDLQNPNDRREILPDEALRSLFNITDVDEEPLTYYGIQKRIQRHIFKVPPVPLATA